MEELEELKQRLQEFADARDWNQFDVQEAQMSREHMDVRSDPFPNKKRMEL